MGRSPQDGLTAKQELFARMAARGESRADIMRDVFGLDLKLSDPKAVHAADAAMHRWRKLPQYQAVWSDEVRTVLMRYTGKALRKLENLADSNQEWVQMQAINTILSYGKQRIFGDEQNAVHVTIEGMPDLGSPDQEEKEDG